MSIPYIQGDPAGLLNNTLVEMISRSGKYQCVQKGGDLLLQVILLSDVNDKIGFQYDRDNTVSRRERNIIGIENRRTATAQVSVYNAHTEELVLGPFEVKGFSEYDYFDSGSPRDMSFVSPGGKNESIIRFSLGQLDSVEGAHDTTSNALYNDLSQKITRAIVYKDLAEKS